jgi:Uma2 family endonuclease
MNTIVPRIPFTYADYKSLPESMDRRYELLGGELYMVPAPTVAHQRVSRNLLVIINGHVVARGLGEVLYAPLDVVFGSGRERDIAQPDLVFVSTARAAIITPAEIAGAPDLIVEILPPGTEERDRSYKKTLYARHGVIEYWIVDVDARVLERYVRGVNDYAEPRRYEHGMTVNTPLLPDLAISLQAVFGP